MGLLLCLSLKVGDAEECSRNRRELEITEQVAHFPVAGFWVMLQRWLHASMEEE